MTNSDKVFACLMAVIGTSFGVILGWIALPIMLLGCLVACLLVPTE